MYSKAEHTLDRGGDPSADGSQRLIEGSRGACREERNEDDRVDGVGRMTSPAAQARLKDLWEERFDEKVALLAAWANMNGTAAIPKDTVVDGVELGRWASTQRAAYRAGRLRSERVERLERVPGWSWAYRRTRGRPSPEWLSKVEILERWADAHGGCGGVERDPGDHRLAHWVTRQRRSNRLGVLSADEIE